MRCGRPNGRTGPIGRVERISKMGGKSTRIGAYKCYQCRKPFAVKVGTILESGHVPMRHRLQAILLLSSSEKGISRKPASPYPWLHPQDRVVHFAPHPRSNAHERCWAQGRRWQW
jgi:hypothetical protein